MPSWKCVRAAAAALLLLLRANARPPSLAATNGMMFLVTDESGAIYGGMIPPPAAAGGGGGRRGFMFSLKSARTPDLVVFRVGPDVATPSLKKRDGAGNGVEFGGDLVLYDHGRVHMALGRTFVAIDTMGPFVGATPTTRAAMVELFWLQPLSA
jgi:hypothetical protein